MKKQIKKVLALFLSAMMVLSIVPTSLFAFADVSENNVVISDVTYETTLNNLSVKASVQTTLKTQFAADAFTSRNANNLVKSSDIKLYTTSAQNEEILFGTYKPDFSCLYNGEITYRKDGSNDSRYEDRSYSSGAPTQNYGFLTVELAKFYDINDLYIAFTEDANDSSYDYEVYISENKDDLYSSENLVIDYYYGGYALYSNNNFAGKINMVDFALAQSSIDAGNYGDATDAVAETQEFVLGTTIKGKYVGIKFNAFQRADNQFFRVSEIGVEGKVSAGQPTTDNVTNTDITDIAVKQSLKVESILPVSLVTQGNNEVFKARKDKNLIKKATEYEMYTDEKMTTVMTQTHPQTNENANVITKVDAEIGKMSDGYTSTYASEGGRLGANYWPLDAKPGYLVIGLDKAYEIGNFYIASGNADKANLVDYEVYASKTKEGLFDAKNIVIDFLYDNNTNKMNKVLSGDSKTADIQDYSFDGVIDAQYVGIKFNKYNASNNNSIRVYEIGLEEVDYFKLDESALNDNTFIVPTKKFYKEGVDYTFKVEVKNGGELEKLYVDGKEITPDNDGVYTVLNATKAMKLTAKTTRDAYSPVDKKWNGFDLSKKSSAYTTSIWDDVQLYETAIFYEGETAEEIETKLETKLLYPIDEIIAVQSYDLKETYYEGEDFIVTDDGALKLTENTRIPVYGRNEGEELKDLTFLDDKGNTKWDSSHGGVGYWKPRYWQLTICVTYTHSKVWSEKDYYVNAPESKLEKLEVFDKKARSGKETNVLFIGDSITVGHSATYMDNWAYKVADSTPNNEDGKDPVDEDGNPKYDDNGNKITNNDCLTHTEVAELEQNSGTFASKYTRDELAVWGGKPWANQVFDALNEKYGGNLNMVMRGVSSSTTTWHASDLNIDFLYGTGEGTSNCPTPDLVIISLGTNEQGKPGVKFMTELKPIIEMLKERNPDCCFVFVSAFYCNRREKDGTLTSFSVADQEAEMLKVEAGTSEVITDNENIIAVPNYSYFESFLNNKTVFDHVAEGLNHPNDFGHNVYAQNVLRTIGAFDCKHDTGNTYVVGKKTATCSTPGYTGDTYCNDCGEIAAKGTNVSCPRSSTTVKNKKTATCTAKGYTGDTYCNTCGELVKKGTATNVVAHKSVTKVTKATLSKNGKITYTCSVCKKATKSSATVYYPKTIKLSTTTYTYNGKTKKPTVKVTDSNGKTISSSNYTVSYAGGRKYPGKYKVTVKFKGNYEGTKTLYFTVKPKKASLSSVKSTAKKKMTVKWSKQSGVTGYEILLATNSKFTKGKKTVTVKGSSSKSKTIKSLKSKKTYYVKVRAYKTIDGKKVYGSYSKYKKVKVK